LRELSTMMTVLLYCTSFHPTWKLTHLMIDWFRFLSSIIHYILHAWQAFVELLPYPLSLVFLSLYLLVIFVIIILMKFQRDIWHNIHSLYYRWNVIYIKLFILSLNTKFICFHLASKKKRSAFSGTNINNYWVENQTD